ncbi:MAG: MBL fold metallo-hydrolase [Defluviitaleaceae bacterium]|nr:MBL fold metallo-hydrolase [Defluviitaleaceae bacterium]
MILTIPVGPLGTNTYIWYDNTSRKGIIIDPGAEAKRILAEVAAKKFDIQAILLTHGHFDHIAAAEEVRNALGVPVYAHKKEAALISDSALNGTGLFRMKPIAVTIDNFLTEENELDFGCGKIHVLHTPGHTLGSVCLHIPEDDVLFAGDTLFKESYGRYDLPTGDFSALKVSLNRLFTLPEDTMVYPGHGSATTIGHEKCNNLIMRT